MDSPVATIEFPQELLTKIDEAVGMEERITFLTEAAETALRRRRMNKFLNDIETNGPAWKDQDHPELADGAYAYVRKLRDEGEKRMQAVEAAWNRD